MTPKEVVPAGFGRAIALSLGGEKETSLFIHDRIRHLPDGRSPELTHQTVTRITIYSTREENSITVCEGVGSPQARQDVVFLPRALKQEFDAMIKPWERNK